MFIDFYDVEEKTRFNDVAHQAATCKCATALAQTQVLRDSFKASKVNPTMPKEGELDKRVIEMANNPKKISTQAIRDAAFKIMTISSENAGSLHALSYIEHVIGDDNDADFDQNDKK